MTNVYLELKNQHQKEFGEFPMVFAFSNEQFEKAMAELGLTKDDNDKIYSFGGGGYYRKTDAEALRNMLARFDKEMAEAIENDETGEGFILDMFSYELSNHEYCITYDISDTLDVLDLTIEQIQDSPKLSHGLKLAKKIALQDE